MKCPKCNCHYEGKQCPNCGTRNLQKDSKEKINPAEPPAPDRFRLFGFRSQKIWKKIISFLYLAYCMILLLGVLIQKRPAVLPERDHWVNIAKDAFLLLIFFSPFIFLSDSFIRNHLPLLKKNKYQTDAIALLLILFLLFLGYSNLSQLHTPEFLADQENHAYELVETKEPSCDKTGEEHYECSFCGTEYYESIPSLGHDLQQTQAEDGSVVWKCTRCDKTQTEAP